MSRVLSTDQAATTITQMQALLNGDLQTNLQNLITQGNTLCDTSVWDGSLANQFSSSWPGTSQQLTATLNDLQQLQQSLATIHQNIFAAGGNA
jgi:hypothetical protein